MKIEDIKFAADTATMIVDGEVYENISLLGVITSQYVIGGNITKKEIWDLQKDCRKQGCKDYLFDYLSKRLKTEREARQKLYEKGYFSDEIDYAVEKAKEYDILNDVNYARAYINTHKKAKSAFLLQMELKGKGLSAIDIMECEDFFLETDDNTTATKLVTKFFGNRERNEKNIKKITDSLLRKGFKHNIIKAAISLTNDDLD